MFTLFPADTPEFSESDDDALESANNSSNTSTSSLGSPELNQKCIDEDTVTLRSGRSSFTTGSVYSVYSHALTEYSEGMSVLEVLLHFFTLM